MTLTAMGSKCWSGTHIEFVRYGTTLTGLTFIWRVHTKRGGACLGEVRWFSRWRKYSFFPNPECVFEQTCLNEIAEFIVARTREHTGKHLGT
jgi:hypothetical protein